MEKRNINSYFEGIICNIDIILNSNFYENKDSLKNVKEIIIKWYDSYKKDKTLKKINYEDLKNIDLEITDFFDNYIAKESIEENYSERLLYDFGRIEKLWKTEMLEGIKNVR